MDKELKERLERIEKFIKWTSEGIKDEQYNIQRFEQQLEICRTELKKYLEAYDILTKEREEILNTLKQREVHNG